MEIYELWQNPLKEHHRIPGIEPRLNQIILPMLSITDDQKLIKDIKQSIEEYPGRTNRSRGLGIEAYVLEAILGLKDMKDQERTVKVVADATNNIIGCSDQDKNALTPQKAGKIIRDALKLKTKRGNKGVYVIWSKEMIAALCSRYGLNEQEETSKEISNDC